MKVSCQWLQEFVDIGELGIDVQGLAEALTRVGLAVEEVVELENDSVLDLDVTTNRPDCLNHLGVAREIAAQFLRPLNSPNFSSPDRVNESSPLSTQVDIENINLCPRYAARVISGVKVEESPEWLRNRLDAIGQRPINNIVDITNYVLMEMGHPLHAFDYKKLAENRIVVRQARSGEVLTTLDGIERQLDSSMLVVCDAKQPVALAGVMGGAETEISESTEIVLLESAYFDRDVVRSAAKALGIRSEASFRFERGADPEIPVKALNRTCYLIQEIAGGVMEGVTVDEYPNPQLKEPISLRQDRIEKVVGVSMDAEFVTNTLTHLNFVVSDSEQHSWQIQVPSFRVDVEIEDDLVEEVTRHYGYDRIKSTYPEAPQAGRFDSTRSHDQVLLGVLGGVGFVEAFNYVFTNIPREQLFWGETPHMAAISNPLTEEETHLRTSLVPGLVEALRHNLNHGNKNIRLFEFGKVFIPDQSTNGKTLQEISRLGLVASGAFCQPFWDSSQDEFHFHHLKGIVECLMSNLGLKSQFQKTSNPSFLHPGVAAQVALDGQALGVLGQLHPELQEAYKFADPVLVAELFLEPLYETPLCRTEYQSLGKLPSVERDLSFVVDKKVEYSRMVEAVENMDVPDLCGVQLLDLYQGQRLPKGKVSLAIRLTFANPDKMLTQGEVNSHTDDVLSALQEIFSVEARSQ
ncbi:MAG: phenylalanine--tRNA ligase subunit beta [Acidobacteriota bacterium]|nr:phenylalanine--tRNA ligase subunit beta [Acidobacteriota bacterium]